MQFLRKETEVPKSKNGLAASLEFAAIQVREGVKDKGVFEFIFSNTALYFHPAVPLVDFEVSVKNDKTDI